MTITNQSLAFWLSQNMTVEESMLTERANSLASRDIKKESKTQLLNLIISCMDLTTLEGADTVGKVRSLCAKAIQPDPTNPFLPTCAAICVYPNQVATAKEALAGTQIKVASVATGFPSGQYSLKTRLAEVKQALKDGADEIDMVINRQAMLMGDYQKVFDEIVAIKQVCGENHLKGILETGELGSFDTVRRASFIAMGAGADFIKTSTGKIGVAATHPTTLAMLHAIKDFYQVTGKKIGYKPAGGIKNSKQALGHVVILHETLGLEWMNPELFRIGASSLLNEVLMELAELSTNSIQSLDYFTVD